MHNHELITQAGIFPLRAHCFIQKLCLTGKVMCFIHLAGWAQLYISQVPIFLSQFPSMYREKAKFSKTPIVCHLLSECKLGFLYRLFSWQILQEIKMVLGSLKYSTIGMTLALRGLLRVVLQKSENHRILVSYILRIRYKP